MLARPHKEGEVAAKCMRRVLRPSPSGYRAMAWPACGHLVTRAPSRLGRWGVRRVYTRRPNSFVQLDLIGTGFAAGRGV